MSYVGWPDNVNKVILDNCKVTVGKGATVKDSLETGGKSKSRMSCANPPDEFSVEMNFKWNEKDANGYTEKDRFLNWYKYVLKYAQNSFYFPSILLNSNNSTGNDSEQIDYGKSTSYEWYRIVSEPEFTKSGMDVKCTMTWRTDATGFIEIPEESAAIDHVVYTNGCIEVSFGSDLQTEPTPNDFSLIVSGTVTTRTALTYSDRTACLYFASKTASGTYPVTLTYKSSDYTGSFSIA